MSNLYMYHILGFAMDGNRMSNCCWCRKGVSEEVKTPFIFEQPIYTVEEIEELLKDIHNAREQRQGSILMSERRMLKQAETENWIMKHFGKVNIFSSVQPAVQISKDVLDNVGNLHWVGAGLTIIASVLNTTLQMQDNKEQCRDVISDLLQIWERFMKPMLDIMEGSASEFMQESMSMIVEGYLYCKSLKETSKLKRFLCVETHKAELGMWRRKFDLFWPKAAAINTVNIYQELLVPLPSPSTIAPTTIVGLEEHKRDVLKLLDLDNKKETRAVVLHGMGGIGKSTLGDLVYNQIQLSGRRCRCRIEIGENPSMEHIRELQKQMVENLTGEKLDLERDPEAVRDKLRKVLTNKHDKIKDAIFIYIDNVLQHEDLEGFLPLECESITLANGSRFLVTTRDDRVRTKVFARNHNINVKEFSVELMSESSAQRLFYLHAFGVENPSSEIVAKYEDNQDLIKQLVTSICGNLPLAVKILGRSLYKEESVSIWREKHEYLKNHPDKGVSKILELSFSTLDTDTQTAFLLICTCFINVQYKTANDAVRSVLPGASTSRLVELCLLGLQAPEELVGEVEKEIAFAITKVHDLVRTLGYQKAVNRNWAPTRMPTCKQDFIVEEDDKSWSTIKWLRVPPLEEGIEASFLDQCTGLEVLVLETHVNGEIQSIPQLKVVISSVSFRAFDLTKLKKLVHLARIQPGDLVQEFPVSPCLQVLQGFGAASIPREATDIHKDTLRKLWCEGLGELTPYFCEQMSKLQSLVLLDFNGSLMPEEMGKMTSLEALWIHSKTLEQLPRSVDKLTRLQALCLLQSRSAHDHVQEEIIPKGVLGGLSQLSYLQLELHEGINSLVPVLHEIGQLASLQHLELHCPSIESLTTPELPLLSLSLPRLEMFYMEFGKLRSLEGVRLCCPSLQLLMITTEQVEDLPTDFIATGLPTLKALILWKCESLAELPLRMTNLSSLEALILGGCGSLKAIPKGLMKSVQSLIVDKCGALQQLPGDLDHQKASSMKMIACPEALLPPHFLSLPNVITSETHAPLLPLLQYIFSEQLLAASLSFAHTSLF